jgi:HEAT repeat protein
MMEPAIPQFPHEVESADLLVHGTVIGVNLNLEDLAKHTPVISCPAERPIRATIQLHVTRSYPELDSETVTFESSLGFHTAMQIAAGDEYIVGLRRLAEADYANVRWLMLRVDPATGHVGFYGLGSAMTVDEFWDTAKVVYDDVHKGTRPSPESIGQLQSSIRTGSLEQCASALAVLHMLDVRDVPPQDLVDALERHNPAGLGSDYAYREMLKNALDLLLPTADEASVARLYKMYVDSRYQGDRAFDDSQEKLFRLFVKFPGPERRERIIQLLTMNEMVDKESGGQRRVELVDHKHHLFAAMAATPDAEIDRIFLEMANKPQEFGIEQNYELSSLWSAMAQRGSEELRPVLQRVLSAPADTAPKHPSEDLVGGAKHALSVLRRNESSAAEPLEMLLAEYDAGDKEVLHLVRKRFPADGSAYIPWLKTAPIREVADLIAHNAPDPSFTPLLTAALDEPVKPPLTPKGTPNHLKDSSERATMLFALYQCGAREDAVKRVVALLGTSPSDGTLGSGDEQSRWSLAQFRWKTELLKLAAYFADESAYPVVASYLDEETLKLYYGMPPTSGEFEGASNDATRLHAAAIVAAARTGKEQAIPLLQKQFDGERKRVAVVAAMALLYLGDQRGEETLRRWANWEDGYRAPHVFVTGEWEDWPRTVSMESLLRSPEIDAFYLDALRSGKHQFLPQSIVKSGIADDRKSDVLPILVDLLSNRDPLLRGDANEALRRLTGQDFGYDARELVTHQQDAIAKWRAYVDTSIHRDDAHPTTK